MWRTPPLSGNITCSFVKTLICLFDWVLPSVWLFTSVFLSVCSVIFSSIPDVVHLISNLAPWKCYRYEPAERNFRACIKWKLHLFLPVFLSSINEPALEMMDYNTQWESGWAEKSVNKLMLLAADCAWYLELILVGCTFAVALLSPSPLSCSMWFLKL